VSRVLFVAPGLPVASDHSGAATRYVQNHRALRPLCRELHVLRLGERATFEDSYRFEAASRSAKETFASSDSWQDLDYDLQASRDGSRLFRAWQSLVDPVGFQFPEADAASRLLAETLGKVEPDLVWVEGTELASCVVRGGFRVPWILSSHDLLHRVQRIRRGAGGLRERWRQSACARAEARVLGAAAVAVSGSRTEARRLEDMGCRKAVVIPVADERMPEIPADARASADVRVVHLGSLETTANRIGLRAYLERAHANVVAACRRRGLEVSLWIVGDASRVREPLAGALERAGAVRTGFVVDLASILRPFDVAILPYEYDSGYRTKLPALLKYAQVVVATKAAVDGTEIAGLDQAGVLLEHLEEFPEAIGRLAADRRERERLGWAAHELARRVLSVDAVRDAYRVVLDEVLSR
jgi:glycosyltransferase involved in cell wall biosynthesis